MESTRGSSHPQLWTRVQIVQGSEDRHDDDYRGASRCTWKRRQVTNTTKGNMNESVTLLFGLGIVLTVPRWDLQYVHFVNSMSVNGRDPFF